MERSIICIDLKSFFASCECLVRNLDPYTTPLVVCDPNRNGAITLAVTPYLKKFGVKGRSRVYELPKDIKILKAPPRMSLYIQKSKEVIETYSKDLKEIRNKLVLAYDFQIVDLIKSESHDISFDYIITNRKFTKIYK